MNNSLILKNVSKVFKTGSIFQKKNFIAVNNASLDLDFDKPKIITIAGESGSGNTTLGNIILGLEKVSSGDYLFKNIHVTKPSRVLNLKKNTKVCKKLPFKHLYLSCIALQTKQNI